MIYPIRKLLFVRIKLVPRNSIKGSLAITTHVNVEVVVKTPTLTEVELIPRGLDSWDFE